MAGKSIVRPNEASMERQGLGWLFWHCCEITIPFSSLSHPPVFPLLSAGMLEVVYQRDGDGDGDGGAETEQLARHDNPRDSSTHSHTANFAPAAEPRVALALLSAPSMDPIH